MNRVDDEIWDEIISPDRGLLDIRLGEIRKHRDLLSMFVWRDFKTTYKQTILGLLWVVLQPVLMMAVYIVVFSKIARIPTEGVPPAVFFLSGIIIWNYFTHCLNKTANTFVQNSNIFGKIYFPRLIIPLSKILSGLINLSVQFVLLVTVVLYFVFTGQDIHMTGYLLMVPVLVLLTACLGLGAGLIISSLTVTYRDLIFVVGFGVQLLMFASAVFYPVSYIPENYRNLILWNPMAHILEAFRYALIGAGEYSTTGILYAGAFAFMMLLSGIVIFNRVEQTFIDSV
ncbi:MAG: ABC transporter permease [Gammaproteobacteria bacterium]